MNKPIKSIRLSMIKIGDTVRYLNAVGGGVVRKIEGKVAYVDEDGFETPVLVNELVVVLPAGHAESSPSGLRPNLYFDQKAFDAGRDRGHDSKLKTEDSRLKTEDSRLKTQDSRLKTEDLKIEETPYGDKLNIAVAFEPTQIRDLGKSDFNAVLVNDSNYFLYFTFMRRSSEERGWHTVYSGEVAPNELIDLAVVRHGSLNDYDRIALQYVAFKKEKEFELKPAASISRRLDLTKFFKLHCFRPGIYFETPVMELRLVKDDVPVESSVLSLKSSDAEGNIRIQQKSQNEKRKPDNAKLSPYKLLPLIEIDLHIDSLVDTTAGMENKDMLLLQLDTVRKTMKEHAKRKGQKIVFIHGKGDGVLRKAVRDLLKKEYPKADIQDASFQEYGFGATLVTI
ncbi:MAG: DUF2027 domain-containing protein [Muribaculaceae bacterium]|nr:DUF2027 domain-containing protein [Muribaculaceae bacterium]